VGERTFRLHRALLWARSAWFCTLLAERWQAGDRSAPIRVTSMTPKVFYTVVDYLYIGYDSRV